MNTKDHKLPELTREQLAEKECSMCAKDCPCKNLRDKCKGYVSKHRKYKE